MLLLRQWAGIQPARHADKLLMQENLSKSLANAPGGAVALCARSVLLKTRSAHMHGSTQVVAGCRAVTGNPPCMCIERLCPVPVTRACNEGL